MYEMAAVVLAREASPADELLIELNEHVPLIVAVVPGEDTGLELTKRRTNGLAFKCARARARLVTVVDDGAPLSKARNMGAKAAMAQNADAVAFIDDDAMPVPGWGEELQSALESGAAAAGGPAIPDWETKRPWWLHEKWDWLVGCGPYYEKRRMVRNTYGCNIAFDLQVFDQLDGFNERYGMGAELGQGEEAELCDRMKDSVEYIPEAAVKHSVPDSKTRPSALFKRALEQGQVKAAMGTGEAEREFAGDPIGMAAGAPWAAAVIAGFLSKRAGL